LNNKAENDLLKIVRVKFRGKKSRYVISRHKYSVLMAQIYFHSVASELASWHSLTQIGSRSRFGPLKGLPGARPLCPSLHPLSPA
jgi:hypothetical protein